MTCMEPLPESCSPPPKLIVSERSFFHEWRGFAVGLALFLVVFVGYIWFVGVFLNARSSDRPESMAGFVTNTTAPNTATAPAELHPGGGAP